MKKGNHQVNVVRVSEILPHTNADALELIHIGGYQVVVRKGQFKPGDLAVYVQPDSVVPQTEPFRFIWGPYAVAGPGEIDPVAVSEKRRRITVKRLRKEYSEGLLLPLSDFGTDGELPVILKGIDGTYCHNYKEGDDVSGLLGITHYDPDTVESTKGQNERGPGGCRRWPRSLKGWLYFILHKIGINLDGGVHGYNRESGLNNLPYYDVNTFKYYPTAFTPGEQVVVTEKIHGCNARFIFSNDHMYAGSRTLWKSAKSNCVWRKALAQNPWIEEWCRAHPGYALYGEVVPTQKGFRYHTEEGQVKLFVFDILTPEREWVPWIPSWPDTFEILKGLDIVPVLYTGPFDMEKIAPLVDGPSTVDVNHPREGVVVKSVEEKHIPGVGRLQLKIVSNAFYEKDK